MKLDARNFKLVRRDFLKLSSASVVAPALASSTVTWKPLPAIGFASALATSPSPRVSIGYWDGRLASSFIDAREIDAADEQLATGIQVRVVGCCGADGVSAWEGFRSASLGFNLLPFHDGDLHAWHYQTSPVVNTSSLATFALPVDRAMGLSGWIAYRETDARSAPARVPFRLGFENASGSGQLRSGYYVIFIRQPGSLLSVDWQSLRLRVTDGGNAITLQDASGRHVDQPHVVMEIDPI